MGSVGEAVKDKEDEGEAKEEMKVKGKEEKGDGDVDGVSEVWVFERQVVMLCDMMCLVDKKNKGKGKKGGKKKVEGERTELTFYIIVVMIINFCVNQCAADQIF